MGSNKDAPSRKMAWSCQVHLSPCHFETRHSCHVTLRFNLDVNPKPFTQGLHRESALRSVKTLWNTITSLVLASVLMTSCEGLPDNPKCRQLLSHFRTTRRGDPTFVSMSEATEAKSDGTATND